MRKLKLLQTVGLLVFILAAGYICHPQTLATGQITTNTYGAKVTLPNT